MGQSTAFFEIGLDSKSPFLIIQEFAWGLQSLTKNPIFELAVFNQQKFRGHSSVGIDNRAAIA
jgi:hypothetical protein